MPEHRLIFPISKNSSPDAHLLSASSSFAADLEAGAPSALDNTKLPSYWEPDLAFGGIFASDSVFRGQSGTDSKPGATGYATVFSGPFYAGAMWMSKDLGPSDPTTAETDFMIGVKPEVGPLRFDFNALYAHLTPDDSGDYWEFKGGVETDLAYGVVAAANFYHAPDYANFDVRENVYEFVARKPIDEKWTISGSVGHVNFSENFLFKSYNYWDAGVSYNVTPSLKIDLRYADTDLGNSACPNSGTCSGRVVLGLSFDTTLRQLIRSGL